MKKLLSNIASYLRSSKAELEKVTWPTKQDTIRYTTVVIVSCAAAAAFFGLVDLGLSKTVQIIVSRNARTLQAPTTNEAPITTEAPQIEGVDAQGNPVQLNIEPVTTSSTN